MSTNTTAYTRADPSADSPTCRLHRDLLDRARGCEQLVDEIPEHPRMSGCTTDDRQQAEQWLHDAAAHLRRTATVFTLDPTLAEETYLGPIEIVCDLARQLDSNVRMVLGAPLTDGKLGRYGRGYTLQWEETGVLMTVLPDRVDKALASARHDHDTPAGQHRISLGRAPHDLLAQQAAELRRRLDHAMHLQHPHPGVARAAALLDDLAEQGEELFREYHGRSPRR